jgi:hypothetical protein
MIARRFYGAFKSVDGIVTPLMAREDFAPDFRNLTITEALERIMMLKQAR